MCPLRTVEWALGWGMRKPEEPFVLTQITAPVDQGAPGYLRTDYGVDPCKSDMPAAKRVGDFREPLKVYSNHAELKEVKKARKRLGDFNNRPYYGRKVETGTSTKYYSRDKGILQDDGMHSKNVPDWMRTAEHAHPGPTPPQQEHPLGPQKFSHPWAHVRDDGKEIGPGDLQSHRTVTKGFQQGMDYDSKWGSHKTSDDRVDEKLAREKIIDWKRKNRMGPSMRRREWKDDDGPVDYVVQIEKKRMKTPPPIRPAGDFRPLETGIDYDQKEKVFKQIENYGITEKAAYKRVSDPTQHYKPGHGIIQTDQMVSDKTPQWMQEPRRQPHEKMSPRYRAHVQDVYHTTNELMFPHLQVPSTASTSTVSGGFSTPRTERSMLRAMERGHMEAEQKVNKLQGQLAEVREQTSAIVEKPARRGKRVGFTKSTVGSQTERTERRRHASIRSDDSFYNPHDPNVPHPRIAPRNRPAGDFRVVDQGVKREELPEVQRRLEEFGNTRASYQRQVSIQSDTYRGSHGILQNDNIVSQDAPAWFHNARGGPHPAPPN